MHLVVSLLTSRSMSQLGVAYAQLNEAFYVWIKLQLNHVAETGRFNMFEMCV